MEASSSVRDICEGIRAETNIPTKLRDLDASRVVDRAIKIINNAILQHQITFACVLRH